MKFRWPSEWLTNNRRLLIVVSFVVVLALIIGGGIWAKRRSGGFGTKLSTACQKAEKDWGTSVEKDQVLYVDGCFVPNSLTITAGESVIFTDKNQPEMWVESDKKDNQLILRNFTSGQNWGPGQSYGYQFDKAGTYGYHNHSKPTDKGQIIVK